MMLCPPNNIGIGAPRAHDTLTRTLSKSAGGGVTVLGLDPSLLPAPEIQPADAIPAAYPWIQPELSKQQAPDACPADPELLQLAELLSSGDVIEVANGAGLVHVLASSDPVKEAQLGSSPHFIRLLTDALEMPQARTPAAAALAALASGSSANCRALLPAVPGLVRLVACGDEQAQHEAAGALSNITEAPDSVKALLAVPGAAAHVAEVLGSQDAATQLAAASIIWHLAQDPSARKLVAGVGNILPKLRRCLGSPEHGVRRAAAGALRCLVDYA